MPVPIQPVWLERLKQAAGLYEGPVEMPQPPPPPTGPGSVAWLDKVARAMTAFEADYPQKGLAKRGEPFSYDRLAGRAEPWGFRR